MAHHYQNIKKRNCVVCGSSYKPVTTWAKYCSKKCAWKIGNSKNKKCCPSCGKLMTVGQTCRECFYKRKKEKALDIDKFKERFFKKVIKTKNCWLWIGAKNIDGHGVIYKHKNFDSRLASRISYQLIYGEIPKGLLILHKCDVPNCVNPDHLELGNHSKNIRDAWKRGLRKFQLNRSVIS